MAKQGQERLAPGGPHRISSVLLATDADEFQLFHGRAPVLWLSVGFGMLPLLAGSGAMLPGAAWWLIGCALYCWTCAIVVVTVPVHLAAAADLVCRLIAIAMATAAIQACMPVDVRPWAQPLFILTMVLPALTYRAVPFALLALCSMIGDAIVMASASGPRSLRVVVYIAFVLIVALLVSTIRRLAGALRASLRRQLDLALTDDLTGLHNRRSFMAACEALVDNQQPTRPVAIVLFDIDHFKRVNDQSGHISGDAVLVGLAEAVRSVCRPDDLPARLGGDEFALLLPGATIDGARSVVGRLAVALAGLRPIAITASYGIAGLSGADRSVDGLLDRADEALYLAKHNGRDGVAIAG